MNICAKRVIAVVKTNAHLNNDNDSGIWQMANANANINFTIVMSIVPIERNQKPRQSLCSRQWKLSAVLFAPEYFMAIAKVNRFRHDLIWFGPDLFMLFCARLIICVGCDWFNQSHWIKSVFRTVRSSFCGRQRARAREIGTKRDCIQAKIASHLWIRWLNLVFERQKKFQ